MSESPFVPVSRALPHSAGLHDWPLDRTTQTIVRVYSIDASAEQLLFAFSVCIKLLTELRKEEGSALDATMVVG